MSVASTNTAIVEVKDVTLAAQHLADLGSRMREDVFTFKNDDIRNIDGIIDSLNELDLVRSRAHEIFETETIKGSALRYKMMHYPGEIDKEIQDAIKAARALNEDTINDLQSQLNTILKTIKCLEESMLDLDHENALLIPERDNIKVGHEEFIVQLNERLADKATEQIDLNETRDDLRETNKKIVDLEEDIVQLKEDMVQEKMQAKHQKKLVVEETKATMALYNEQHAKNEALQKDYNTVSHELTESSLKKQNLKKSIKTHEKNIENLIAEEKKGRNQLDQVTQTATKLKDLGIKIRDNTSDMTAKHDQSIIEMNYRIKQLEGDIIQQQKLKINLETQKENLAGDLENAKKIREMDAKVVRDMNDDLQRAKEDLAMKAEDIGRLRTEIFDMEEKLINATETHRSIVAMLNKQIGELRDLLARERHGRMEMQQGKDSLQRDIDEFRAKNAKFMKEMNARIKDGKEEHSRLSKEHTRLQVEIRDNIALAAKQEIDLKNNREEFVSTKANLEQKIVELEEGIKTTEVTLVTRKEELEDMIPKFKEFEEYYNVSIERYDVLKKLLISRKSRRQNLEDSTKRSDMQISQQKPQLSAMESDLKKKQAEVREQIATHTAESTEIEKSIYATGCKLKVVLEENARLDTSINQITADIARMREQWEGAIHTRTKMHRDLELQKEILGKGWSEDEELKQFFAEKDLRLLKELEKVQQNTDQRYEKITEVTENLQQELYGFTEFLDTVGSRKNRPQKGEARERLIRGVQNVLASKDVLGALKKKDPF